ncbi:SURF1 family protein [Brevibacterium daeguense]|uniref:SURF1-like protein n=1 Tax=Brevibacterium daeguense TaxID=909936 RepID=A0ABP8EG36_9MICO|nr:SURF1 family protein [Brevibacterium daeguense]
MLRLALTPRWLGFLALVLLLATAFVGLSAWQVDRAQHKNDVLSGREVDVVQDFNTVLEAQVPTPSYLLDQRVELTGHYLPDAQVVVPARYLDGEEGFWVVTMFVPDGAEYGADATFAGEPREPIAVPVVRGWTADENHAMSSQPAEGEATIVGRIGPVEGPENTSGLPAGQVRTVSTSQLVNYFDVHSYSAIVFPESDTGPGASAGTDGLTRVELDKQESGGFDWQSAAYAIEWLIFAAFAIYIWWRLLRDEHLRAQAAQQPAGATEYVVVKAAGETELHTPEEASSRPDSGAASRPAGLTTKDMNSEH